MPHPSLPLPRPLATASARQVALALAGLIALVPAAHGALRFVEASDGWSLVFRHHHGGSGRRYMPETMVGGVVVFDYDGDGDEDVFFVDAGALPGYSGEEPRSRLFRNDRGRFVDVTERSGIAVAGYGAGAIAGDVDGDGDLDLFVTALGPDQLFRNEGNGRFSDVTSSSGLGDPAWGASAAFADTDRDGDLDLYLANYVHFTPATHRDCRDPATGIVGYCAPTVYPGVADRFYRNRGDGSFEDATAAAGLAEPGSPGLGVVFADFDNDGWPDLYVANDGEPNFLYRNRGDGTFEDFSLLSGTALSPRGRPEAGMGVDADDYDNDGLLDIVVTNFDLETNALYRNLGSMLFHDSRFLAAIAEPSLLFLAFGVDLADLDNDGDLDLVVANGHVNDAVPQLRAGAQFAQRNQLFENLGDGKFREETAGGLDVVRVSRGLATGDLDQDLDLDLLIVNADDRAEVYDNVAGATSGGALFVALVASQGNTFGIGGRVELISGTRRQVREVRTGASYLSQHALPLHFGLGAATSGDRLTVRWPAGRTTTLLRVPANRRLVIFD